MSEQRFGSSRQILSKKCLLTLQKKETPKTQDSLSLVRILFLAMGQIIAVHGQEKN